MMRRAMTDHGITAAELVDYIHRSIGGDRQRIDTIVHSFVAGNPGPMAVHVGIIGMVADHARSTVH
jgi:hypothetical protein